MLLWFSVIARIQTGKWCTFLNKLRTTIVCIIVFILCTVKHTDRIDIGGCPGQVVMLQFSFYIDTWKTLKYQLSVGFFSPVRLVPVYEEKTILCWYSCVSDFLALLRMAEIKTHQQNGSIIFILGKYNNKYRLCQVLFSIKQYF